MVQPIYNFQDFNFATSTPSMTSTTAPKFDLGSLLGGAQSGELEGTLGMAANAILPGSGALLAPILDGLKLDENFQLAKKYGWNSWGASASPESISQEFESITKPEVVRLMQNVSTDPQKALSDTKVYLESIVALRNYLRQRHSKANSTKQANELMAEKCSNLLRDVVQSAVTKLKSIGCIVSEVTYTDNPTFKYAYSHWGNTTLSNAMNDRAVANFKPKGYKITASSALKKQIEKLKLEQNNPTPVNNGNSDYDVDLGSGFVDTDYTTTDQPQIPPDSKKSDSTIYIIIAAIILLFWKNIKKLIQ